MAYPLNVKTRLVSFGGAATVEAGIPLHIRISTESSRSLIWVEDGYRLESLAALYMSAIDGQEIIFEVPTTDQNGWLDAATRQAIIVEPGEASHLYTTKLEIFTEDHELIRTYEIGPYAVPEGPGTLDADLLNPNYDPIEGTLTVYIPGPDGELSAAGQQAAANAVQAAIDAEGYRDEAEVFSATTVELQDTAVAALIDTPGSETRTQLGATFADKDTQATVESGRLSEAQLNATIDAAVAGASPARGLAVTNLAGLSRWQDARGNAYIRPVVVTAIGDSITWGVGSDDTNDSPSTAAMNDIYRERSYFVQLRKRMNALYGCSDANGWMGIGSAWWSGEQHVDTSQSASLGPFGDFGGGGFSVSHGDSITFDPENGSRLGAFTQIEVFYWGVASGASTPSVPKITIDEVVQNTPPATSPTGYLQRQLIHGLTDAPHKVVIERGEGTPGPAYVYAVVVRRDPAGFVFNRIARSGAASGDVMNQLPSTGANLRRLAAVTHNTDDYHSDLVMLALGTNDQGAQVPLATYKANLKQVIDYQVDVAKGCVLLVGQFPDPTPTAGVSEDAYRGVMRDLALENEHVAYTDMRDLFGDPSTLLARGLIPVAGTVHPTAKGHGVMANALVELLTLPRYV